jgi:hypothetical protein
VTKHDFARLGGSQRFQLAHLIQRRLLRGAQFPIRPLPFQGDLVILCAGKQVHAAREYRAELN